MVATVRLLTDPVIRLPPLGHRSLANAAAHPTPAHCREFIENSPTKPVRILDIGGTVNYWEIVDCTSPGVVDVVILNLDTRESDGGGAAAITASSLF